MLNGKVKYWVAACAGLALTGCRDSFDESLAMPYDPNEDFSTTEWTTDRVPINMSIQDPEVALTVTRGAGPMDLTQEGAWSIWGSTERDFRVLAFRAPNELKTVSYKGYTPDYADWDNSEARLQGDGNCLLDNVRAHFVNRSNTGPYGLELLGPGDDGSLQPKTYYYNSFHPDYRYKFFINHTDGSGDPNITPNIHKEAGRITQSVKIDGTQDLMVGFAYHTPENWKDFLERNKSNGDDSEIRLMAQNEHQLAYSNVSAHRGMEPQFWLKHVLVGFDFHVLGRPMMNVFGEMENRYKGVILYNVTVRAATKGELTLADADWDFDFKGGPNKFIDDSKVVDPESKEPLGDLKHYKLFNVTDEPEDMKALGFNEPEFPTELPVGIVNTTGDEVIRGSMENGRHCYVDRSDVEAAMHRKLPGNTWYQVYNSDARMLSRKSFMVPALGQYEVKVSTEDGKTKTELKDEHYTVRMDYVFVEYEWDEAKKKNVVKTVIENLFSMYTISKPADAKCFLPGYKYNVHLTVYGPQEIKMSVQLDPGWIEWDTPVVLDPDN